MELGIDVKFCPACGQLQEIGIVASRSGVQLVTVYCPCGQTVPQTAQIAPGDSYYLNVETKPEEAQSDDDSCAGDVPAGGEAGRDGDA